MPATEQQIRQALHRDIVPSIAGEGDPVIEELGLCNGEARVDMAIINGSLHGFEIKSERDTLARLPRQVEYYGRVLDLISIVVADNHAAAASKVVPPWWGIISVQEFGGIVGVRWKREAKPNKAVEGSDVARLLWRDELVVLVQAHDVARGTSRMTHIQLARHLAEKLTLEQLRNEVRAVLKRRCLAGWRSVQATG